MFRRAKLIVWDEAQMMHKYAVEAIDATLWNIHDRPHILFGGITFVMYGDFHQVLPAVQKGLRPNIIATSIKESYLWSHVTICMQCCNMRL